MPSIQPARFPSLRLDETEFINLVVNKRPWAPIMIGDEEIALTLGPPCAPPPHPVAVRFEAPNERLWLVMEQERLAQWLWPLLGRTPLDALPEVLAHAALQATLAPIQTALKTFFGTTLEPVLDNSAILPDNGVRVGFWQDRRFRERSVALLYLERDSMPWIQSRLAELPRFQDDAHQWMGLPIILRLHLGQMQLAIHELRSLESEDILLLPIRASAEAPIVWLRQNAPIAGARLQGRQCVIEQLVEKVMPELEIPPDDERSPAELPAVSAAAIDPDGLETRLDFDLGHISLSLGDLQTLAPGQAFTLDRPEQHPVRLLAGSRMIGEGELVEIDGRLGVRVIKLRKAPG